VGLHASAFAQLGSRPANSSDCQLERAGFQLVLLECCFHSREGALEEAVERQGDSQPSLPEHFELAMVGEEGRWAVGLLKEVEVREGR
jgi:hypothetical protein